MTPDQLKALLTNMLVPIQTKIDTLSAASTGTAEARSAARKAELEAKKHLMDEELKMIADKTWKTPFEVLPINSTVALKGSHDPDAPHKRLPQFDSSSLPKFKQTNNVEQ